MATVTVQQQKAIALAAARRRKAEAAGGAPGNAAPSPAFDEALNAASAASKQFAGGPVTPRDQTTAPVGSPDLLGATAATLAGGISGIPIAGPVIQKASDAILAGGGMLADQVTGNTDGADFGGRIADLESRRAALAAANPVADVAGNVAGTIASLGAGSATKLGAEVLGTTGKLVPRIVNSATSGAALSAGDTIIRGGELDEALTNGAIGGAAGGLIPAAGALVGLGVKAAGRAIEPTVNAIRNSGDEAARRLGMAVTRDVAGNADQVLTAADDIVAREAGVPIINADRGGEVTRALTRSVANQSPEARATIQAATDDRFGTQGQRAIDVIRKVAGGNADDVGFQQMIKQAAQATNKPRYDAAYQSPKAQAIWTPELQNLMQASPFRAAIKAAEETATNAAAVSGGKAVRNPFEFLADGTARLKTNADGSRALPNLEFWDIVQRNLRNLAEQARGKGDNLGASQIGDMRTQLINTLDTEVPLFQQARRGAASFFDADDALDAGRKFANQPRNIPEAKQAFSKFTENEKAAFRTGYASEIIDRIKATRDRVNVINTVFGSQASREMAELVFGKQKADQLEAYVRVEGIVDKLRGALGNSTTARQLAEMGIGAGTGAVLTGGDWKGALTGAAVAKGARYAGERIDGKVMQELARLLTSNDPKLIEQAVQRAAIVPQYMKALEAMQSTLAAPARSVSLLTTRPD